MPNNEFRFPETNEEIIKAFKYFRDNYDETMKELEATLTVHHGAGLAPTNPAPGKKKAFGEAYLFIKSCLHLNE